MVNYAKLSKWGCPNFLVGGPHTEKNGRMKRSIEIWSAFSNTVLKEIPKRIETFSVRSTYVCMSPTSTGRNERRFPDKLSSVSEERSRKASGNSDSALFDKFRVRN